MVRHIRFFSDLACPARRPCRHMPSPFDLSCPVPDNPACDLVLDLCGSCSSQHRFSQTREWRSLTADASQAQPLKPLRPLKAAVSWEVILFLYNDPWPLGCWLRCRLGSESYFTTSAPTGSAEAGYVCYVCRDHGRFIFVIHILSGLRRRTPDTSSILAGSKLGRIRSDVRCAEHRALSTAGNSMANCTESGGSGSSAMHPGVGICADMH